MIYILYLLVILIIFYVLNNHINLNYENFSNNNEIPKIIVSTYYDKNKIPQKVYDNMKEYASNYKFKVYDDQEIALFLKK